MRAENLVHDRRCGSGQQAVFAVHGVLAGAYDIVIAGGVESMSRVPMGSARVGADPYGPGVTARYAPGLVPQGISAELVASKYGLSRTELDEYAARSHQRAESARAAFEGEIVRIATPTGAVARDETIRPDTTAERLAAPPPAFQSDDVRARFPQIPTGR